MHILNNVINLAKWICIIKLFSDQSGQAHFLVDFTARLSILSHAAWLMLNYLCFPSKHVSCRNFGMQLLFCECWIIELFRTSYHRISITNAQKLFLMQYWTNVFDIKNFFACKLQLIQNPNLIVYRFCSAVNYD